MTLAITSSDGFVRAEFNPEDGGLMTALQVRKDDKYIDIGMPGKSGFGMAPWPGRLPEKTVRTPDSPFRIQHPHPLALHGFAKYRPSTVLNQTASAAKLQYRYEGTDPELKYVSNFEFHQSFRALPGAFAFELSLVNVGRRIMPAGIGFHPFFQKDPFGTGEMPQLDFIASRYFPFAKAEPLIPVAGVEEIPAKFRFQDRQILHSDRIDHCYYGWNGVATAQWKQSNFCMVLRLSAESADVHRHFHLWTGNDGLPDVFAFEAQTTVANGLSPKMSRVRANGMQFLRPSEQLRLSGELQFLG